MSYSVIDGYGARASFSPLSYIGWSFILNAAIFPILLIYKNKARTILKIAKEGKKIFFIGGTISYMVYAIVVWSFTQAPILDGCDGEIARLKLLESKFGGWFDRVLDRYSDLFIFTGLTFHTYFIHKTLTVFLIGFIAVGGKIISSYTAFVYDTVVSAHNNFRIGRDLIIFIILIGALLNIPYITLVVLAFIMNAEVCKRLWILKDKLDY